jgi:hypothetical protein
VPADETIKANGEGLTHSGHVINSIQNIAGETDQNQPLVPKALLYDNEMYCFWETKFTLRQFYDGLRQYHMLRLGPFIELSARGNHAVLPNSKALSRATPTTVA